MPANYEFSVYGLTLTIILITTLNICSIYLGLEQKDSNTDEDQLQIPKLKIISLIILIFLSFLIINFTLFINKWGRIKDFITHFPLLWSWLIGLNSTIFFNAILRLCFTLTDYKNRKWEIKRKNSYKNILSSIKKS